MIKHFLYFQSANLNSNLVYQNTHETQNILL